MPEGHTVHRVAREQRRVLVGRRVRATSPQGRFAREAARLDGRVLDGVEAYGKHLFYAWRGRLVVHVHLGMRGVVLPLALPAPPPRPQVRLRLEGPAGGADLIAPAICALVDPAARAAVVARLGPDPLRDDAEPARAWARVRRSDRSIGALLLDQAVVAGVGNVLRAEALFAVGLDPRRPGRAVARGDLDRLWNALRRLMRDAAAGGRILSLPIPDDAPEADGRFVYRQATCRRCGTPVRTATLGGRTAWWCPVCQPPAERRLAVAWRSA